jgi:hypothetical protein
MDGEANDVRTKRIYYQDSNFHFLDFEMNEMFDFKQRKLVSQSQKKKFKQKRHFISRHLKTSLKNPINPFHIDKFSIY